MRPRESLGYVQEAQREMLERSSRFGDVDRRSMWSATYRRIFRSVYPQETCERLENHAVRNVAGRDSFQTHSAGSFSRNYVNQSQTIPHSLIDPRGSKRVSIDESEARSTLSKKAYDHRRGVEATTATALIPEPVGDDDVREYIRDVMEREFRGECRDVTVLQLNHHPEAVFNKTLKFAGPEKTVYIHLRNRVRTSSRQENREEDQTAEPMWPYDSLARRRTSRESENSLYQRANDSAAHTKASSWTGPHPHLPAETPILSSPGELRNFNYYGDSEKGILKQSQQTFDELRRRIIRGEPLDREDLLELKWMHCARVAEDEDELFALLRFPRAADERRISRLRETLSEFYLSYEDLLQAALPTRSTSAVLAHRILLADAYFFHARVEASESAQQRLYRRSIEVYTDLLELAKRSLLSTDDSLLCVVEKISQILRESHINEPALVLEITTLLDKAESDLRSRPNMEAQRTIRRARDNIAALGSYYYLYF
ncbi:hypothetical protein Y032_0159g3319 [Ancylostoma ceylanicum]|nr:hypothetical protein Y032_0159g3319 [Ancylostoma ceylanicum]